MKILWLYGSNKKWDAINHWYHMDWTKVIKKQPNVQLIAYGWNLDKMWKELTPIPFDIKITGKDIKKEFNFDVIIINNKNRFFINPLKRKTTGWLSDNFFDGLLNIPKIILEGDYHQHRRGYISEDFLEKVGIDLILHRHLANVKLAQKDFPNIKSGWLPCSVDNTIFKPNYSITREKKICLIGGWSPKVYTHRNLAGSFLLPTGLLKQYKQRLLGQDYVNCLQSYIGHINGSSKFDLTTAKMFEIMASGSVLLTDKSNEYGLKELFVNDSYCVYERNGLDIVEKSKLILNDKFYRNHIIKRAIKCIKERHTHEIRAGELIEIIARTFGMTYKAKTSKNIFGRIEQFFKKDDTNSIPIITNTIKPVEENEAPDVSSILSLPNTEFENKVIALKNEEKIRKLNSKNIKICVLKQTCYNILFNNKIGDTLDIVVEKSDKSKRILGESFEFLPIPKETKRFIYKNMEIYIPYPILPYLKNVYGNEVIEKFKQKKERLRLIHGIYKFSNR